MKIVHVINGLDIGGAETMLLRLLSQCDRQNYDFEVLSLTDLGAIADGLRALGVPVRELGLRRGAAIPDPRAIFWLAGWLRQSRPGLVQTWMYHACQRRSKNSPAGRSKTRSAWGDAGQSICALGDKNGRLTLPMTANRPILK